MSHPFKKRIFIPILQKVSLDHLTFFLKRVKRGIDAEGMKFPKYSEEYADYKSRGFERKDGKGRLKAYKQKPITSRQVGTPDFTVTGLTLKNANPSKPTKRGWHLKFTGQAGDIVEGNKAKGRDIISQIPNKEEKFVAKLIEKKLVKYYNRPWTEKIVIRSR